MASRHQSRSTARRRSSGAARERGEYMVFEVVNGKLKELLVAPTILPMFEVMERLRARLPEPIAHWKAEDISGFRSMDFHLDLESARGFIEGYVAGKPDDWRCRFLAEPLDL